MGKALKRKHNGNTMGKCSHKRRLTMVFLHDGKSNHDPLKNMNLTQNMEGIKREYNRMGLRILGAKRKIKIGNNL